MSSRQFPVALLALASLFLGTAESALAQGAAPIIGDIEGAEFRAYPIAVPDVRVAPGRPDADKTTAVGLSKIVRDDLALSGVFNVLDPKSYIDTDGVTLSTVKFDDWLNVGAEGLVKAALKPSGKGFSVEVHAYEVATAREGFKKNYALTSETLRDVGHAIADDIYRHYTGEPGVFRTKIAVVRKVSGAKHIFIVDMDGKRSRQLTDGGSLNLLPAWSPDGKNVVFTSYRYDNPDLFEMPSAGGKAKRISAQSGLNTGGKISPNGRDLALTLSKDGNSEIYVLDRSGKIKSRLTNSWGIDTSPDWSPDGKKIAFVSSRAGNPHIYVMNADGSAQKRLTFQGTYNQTPSYSPRGTHIAFTARDEFNRFDIFLFDLRENKIVRLTQDQGNNEDPTFAPNGRLVAFISDRSGSKQIWITNLDGTFQKQITAGGAHSSPSWGPLSKK